MQTASIRRAMALLAICCSAVAASLSAQSGACPEADKINDEIRKCNQDYEKIKSDYSRGLFCSQCKDPKTVIEAGGESFEHHLTRVSGVAVPATQEMYDKAHEKYKSQYDLLKGRFENAIAGCNKRAQEEQERQQREAQRERERQQQEWERQRQEAQREAEEKQRREQEAAERRKAEEEAARARAEEARLQEQERLRRELAERQEALERQLEAQRQEARAQLNTLLDAMTNSRQSRIDAVADDVRQSLSQYADAFANQTAEVWQAAKTGISNFAGEKVQVYLSNTTLDDDNFNETANTVSTALKSWNAFVDQESMIEYARYFGLEQALSFGQINMLQTAAEITENYHRLGLDFLNAAIDSNLNLENLDQQVDEILNSGYQILIRNGLNNFIPYIQLGDRFFPRGSTVPR